MSAAADQRFMRMALALAGRRLGQVWPNPSVGCVIVSPEGRVLGRAATAAGGRPHAEPQALAQAGAGARGATAFVTLEPCAHHGRTPPCAEALVAAGVSRVVSALEDPDPRVAGGGHALLRAAGIAVQTGVCADEAAAVNRGFLSRITSGRPMLTLKLATSLDGRIATAAGESRWITGPQSRARVHLMRAHHDAVLVGGGTARADDPRLTVRGLGIRHQPVRIIASARLDLPRGGALWHSVPDAPLWLMHGPDAPAEAQQLWAEQGAHLFALPLDLDGALDAGAMLRTLGDQGLTRIFCEGGGALAASLLRAGLVDEMVLFSAGVLLGADGRPGLGGLGLAALAQAPRLTLCGFERVGGDVLTRWSRG